MFPDLKTLRAALARHALLLVVVGLYLAIHGWLLARSGALPYVFDNNESFSTYVHGKNMHDFSQVRSRGLTDEAYGRNPAAHPYVYTHQGNFPRLFSWILYSAGLTSIESQIVATTFSVGLASAMLGFLFFARLAGQGFALIVMFLLLSDYLLYAQWQVNTFRVWHPFLLFGALFCVQSILIGGVARERHLAALAIIYACVWYFDLLMAVFTTVFVAAYLLWEGRRCAPRLLLKTVGAAASGGLLGVGTLLLQLIAYYGWQGLIDDARMTYMARNLAEVSGANAAAAMEFFANHRIVYWDKYVSSVELVELGAFLRSVFKHGWIIYSPLLCFALLAVLCPWLLSCAVPVLHRLLRTIARVSRTVAAQWAIVFAVAALVALLHVPHGWIPALLTLLQCLLLAAIVRHLVARPIVFVRWCVRGARAVRRYRFSACVGSLALAIAALCAQAFGAGESNPGPLLFAWAAIVATAAILLLDSGRARFVALEFPAAFSLYLAVFLALLLVGMVTLSDKAAGMIPWHPTVARLAGANENLKPLLALLVLAAQLALGLTLFLRGAVFPRGSSHSPAFFRRARLLDRALILLAALSLASWVSPYLFEFYFPLDDFWRHVLYPWGQSQGKNTLLLLATGVGCCLLAVFGSRAAQRLECSVLRRLSGFFFAGFLGFASAYYFSPGFMFAVHLGRFSPVLVFLLAPACALAILVLIRAIGYLVRQPARQRGLAGAGPAAFQAPRQLALSAVCMLLCALSVYWLGLQASYVRLLPPDQGEVLKRLAADPYRDKAFVTNSYAAPIASMTGHWAYLNPEFFSHARLEPGERGYAPAGYERYLWFANRDDSQYKYPAYAFCFMTPDLQSVLSRLRIDERAPEMRARVEELLDEISVADADFSNRGFPAGCVGIALRMLVLNRSDSARLELVDYDRDALGRWAILRMPSQSPAQ